MTFDGQITAGAGTPGEYRAGVGRAPEEIERLLDEGRRRREAQIIEPCRLDLLPLTRLIGYLIDKHHVYARRQVAAVAALLARLSAGHEKSPPELARVRGLFKVLRQELLFHMEKEEVSLFPQIIRTETNLCWPEPPAAPNFGPM